MDNRTFSDFTRNNVSSRSTDQGQQRIVDRLIIDRIFSYQLAVRFPSLTHMEELDDTVVENLTRLVCFVTPTYLRIVDQEFGRGEDRERERLRRTG